VSVDGPEQMRSLANKLHLGFPLYTDPDRQVITRWGVGDTEAAIALPATFVVAPGGGVVYRQVGESPADRPSVEEVLRIVREHAERSLPL